MKWQNFSTICCIFYLAQTGVELELIEKLPLLEWLANNYKTFGKYMDMSW